MRFSVVIPLYNKRDYIARAIQSVLSQSEAFEELVVVDDGSTDGGGEIAEDFGGKVRVFRQDNAGEAAARNRGIREAQGSHIAFLDADDRWKPHFLKVTRNLIADHPEAAIYGTGLEAVLPDGTTISRMKRVARFVDAAGRLDYPKALAHWCFPLTSSSVCVPASAFEKAGGFDESLKIGTDIDMWLRLALAGGAAFDCRICAVYQTDAANRSVHQPDFWANRLQFADTLSDKMASTAMTDLERSRVRRFIAQTMYESMVGAANADRGYPLRKAMHDRRRALPMTYFLRARVRELKRYLAGNA